MSEYQPQDIPALNQWKNRTMAYDVELESRIDELLAAQDGLAKRKMFGGLCYTINGNMCCGIMGDRLMVRICPDEYDALLKRTFVEPAAFKNNKPMRGMVFVRPEGIRRNGSLSKWLAKGVAFAGSLPAK